MKIKKTTKLYNSTACKHTEQQHNLHTMRIAFIDDGINGKLMPITCKYSTIKINGNSTEIIPEHMINECSHGSLCASVFCKYLKCRSNLMEIVCISVLDCNLKGKTESLIAALRWCTHNDISIVNCSVGTVFTAEFEAIEKALSDVAEKGIIVVAAMNNSSRYSFPACSDHVIGVKNSFLYNNGKFKIQWYPFDDIEIVTGGRHELLLKNNTVFHTPGSNSFSAPVITAKITDCISGEKHVQKYNVLKMLEQDASTVIGEYIFPFSPYPWNNINSSITEPVFSSILVNRVISSKKESEVPIIRMSGNNSSAESLFFGMLKAFFVNKSVSVYSLTSVFSEMDRSCIYCPEGCDYNSLIISITQKFDCQLVLVHGEIENYDIGIFIGSDVISTECDGVCRDFNGFSVNSVLEYIYDMLI